LGKNQKINGKELKKMPSDFDRPPIDIQRHSAGFKAEDWKN